jgi:hypothetical protein
MSNYDPEQPVQAYAAPPRKPGMSSGAKVAIILCVVFGGLAVLCCGFFGAVGWWSSKAMINDPAKVAAKTAEIATIDIPAPLQPVMAMDMNVPFVGQMMVMVVYNGPNNSMLMLTAAGEGMDEASRAEMQRGMAEGMKQQNVKQQEMIVAESDSKKVTIGGEEVEFTIEQGEAPNGTSRIRAVGTFPGSIGPVTLLLDVDANAVTREQVDDMLDSIRQ